MANTLLYASGDTSTWMVEREPTIPPSLGKRQRRPQSSWLRETVAIQGETTGEKNIHSESDATPPRTIVPMKSEEEITPPPMPDLAPWHHDALEFHASAPVSNNPQGLSKARNALREHLYTGLFNLTGDFYDIVTQRTSLKDVTAPWGRPPHESHPCQSCHPSLTMSMDQRISSSLRDNPQGMFDFTQVIDECLHEREILRLVSTLRSSGREEFAHLYLRIHHWSKEHGLGLIELLDATEENGEPLAKGYYDLLTHAVREQSVVSWYQRLEYIAVNLPRQLLRVTIPSTAEAEAARRWLGVSQGYKRTHSIVGIPSLKSTDIFFLLHDLPLPEHGQSAEERMEKQLMADLDYWMGKHMANIWHRPGMFNARKHLEKFAENSGLPLEDLSLALRGVEAMDSLEGNARGEMCYLAMAHPELFNYDSFLALGHLVEEYNVEWAIAAWDMEETAQPFMGFSDLVPRE